MVKNRICPSSDLRDAVVTYFYERSNDKILSLVFGESQQFTLADVSLTISPPTLFVGKMDRLSHRIMLLLMSSPFRTARSRLLKTSKVMQLIH